MNADRHVRGYWDKLECTGELPANRSGHTCVLYKERYLYVFGGFDGANCFDDVYELDIDTRVWRCVNARGERPSGRASHSAVADDIGGVMYVFGGSGSHFGYTNKRDLHMYNFATETWVLLANPTEDRPSARYGQSMVLYKEGLYVWGGTHGTNYPTEMYRFDICTKTWDLVVTSGDAPVGRYRHQCMVKDDVMYIVGGSGHQRYGDVFTFRFTTNMWRRFPCTGTDLSDGRYAHSAVLRGKYIYLYGGNDGVRHDDLLQLDLERRIWSRVSVMGSPPHGRDFHAAVLRRGSLQECMIVFGGSSGMRRHNDCYEFRFGPITPPIPPCTLAQDLLNLLEKCQVESTWQGTCDVILVAAPSDEDPDSSPRSDRPPASSPTQGGHDGGLTNGSSRSAGRFGKDGSAASSAGSASSYGANLGMVLPSKPPGAVSVHCHSHLLLVRCPSIWRIIAEHQGMDPRTIQRLTRPPPPTDEDDLFADESPFRIRSPRRGHLHGKAGAKGHSRAHQPFSDLRRLPTGTSEESSPSHFPAYPALGGDQDDLMEAVVSLGGLGGSSTSPSGAAGPADGGRGRPQGLHQTQPGDGDSSSSSAAAAAAAGRQSAARRQYFTPRNLFGRPPMGPSPNRFNPPQPQPQPQGPGGQTPPIAPLASGSATPSVSVLPFRGCPTSWATGYPSLAGLNDPLELSRQRSSPPAPSGFAGAGGSRPPPAVSAYAHIPPQDLALINLSLTRSVSGGGPGVRSGPPSPGLVGTIPEVDVDVYSDEEARRSRSSRRWSRGSGSDMRPRIVSAAGADEVWVKSLDQQQQQEGHGSNGSSESTQTTVRLAEECISSPEVKVHMPAATPPPVPVSVSDAAAAAAGPASAASAATIESPPSSIASPAKRSSFGRDSEKPPAPADALEPSRAASAAAALAPASVGSFSAGESPDDDRHATLSQSADDGEETADTNETAASAGEGGAQEWPEMGSEAELGGEGLDGREGEGAANEAASGPDISALNLSPMEPIVVGVNVLPSILMDFVSFLYSDQPAFSTLPVNDLYDLYVAGRRFNIPRLAAMIERHIKIRLSVSNVVPLLSRAVKDSPDTAPIEAACKKFFLHNYAACAEREECEQLGAKLLCELMRLGNQRAAAQAESASGAGSSSAAPPPGGWSSTTASLPLSSAISSMFSSVRGLSGEPSSLNIPPRRLAEDLQRLLIEQILSDYTVVVEGTQGSQGEAIAAHKFLLAARCHFFAAASVTSGMQESRADYLVVPADESMTPEAFRTFLRFCYAGDNVLKVLVPHTAMYLIEAAGYYGLSNERLRSFCELSVKNSFNEEHVLDIFAASHSLKVEAVREMALQFIVTHFDRIGKQPGLEKLDKSLLIEILRRLADRGPKSQATPC
ncbi:unnamed protein product [Vitrella brassicaformis CCMP3155]|uniref:BTB domain-containing protein n=3 Tax=Vitrella brassicaformis TaxID=1169539 RepID=A0A0G4E9X9_VITBC|nr:unnamed protein product [Vitrella brassicaformis CCMP3155]|eukprot:CEL92730.1 unnamed protein product [Vitrella brassicaformis CCMP3155]